MQMSEPSTIPSLRAQPVEPERLAELVADRAVSRGALLLCTDFDGSIAPIRSEPGEVHALPAAERALAWLSRRGAGTGQGGHCPTRVALVTARNVEDVSRRIVLGSEAAISRHYGQERWPPGRRTRPPEAARCRPPLGAATAGPQ